MKTSKSQPNATADLIESLRSETEHAAGRHMVTPADFDFLSEAILTATRLSVSPTTLKRVWGYLRDTRTEYTPAGYTLSALSRFIGFKDFEDFKANRSDSSSVQSDYYFGETIFSSDIPEGAIVELHWHPNRRVHLKHAAGNDFTVILSENAKLRPLDKVECYCFTRNAPLHLSRVRRESEPDSSYIAGSRSGISFTVFPLSEPTEK